jgi:hypothetical protein
MAISYIYDRDFFKKFTVKNLSFVNEDPNLNDIHIY